MADVKFAGEKFSYSKRLDTRRVENEIVHILEKVIEVQMYTFVSFIIDNGMNSIETL